MARTRSGKRQGQGAGSRTDSVRDVLRARYSELTQDRRFPRADGLVEYTRAIIDELAKSYKNLYDEQLISQLAAASDERQWLDMLLGSFPVCVEELCLEVSRYSTQEAFPPGEEDYRAYSLALLSHLAAFVRTLGAGLRNRLTDGRLPLKLTARVQDAHGWLQVLLGHVRMAEHVKVQTAAFMKMEEDQLRKEFERDYQDPGGEIVSYAVDYIQLCYKNWSEHFERWYAPCTAVVQSSGWGKSRLMREIAYAQNQVTVLYFSLMKLEHRGYPRSTAEILSYFTNIRALENAYAIFAACFDWLSSQDTFPDKRRLFQKHQEKDYEHILEKLRIRHQCSVSDMEEACEQAVSKHKSSLKENGVSFLFVIDEARTLLKTAEESPLDTGGQTPFVLFRRACAALPIAARSFVLFVDTASKVSNFTPSQRSDPSTRVVKGEKRLFAPICRLATFDLSSSSRLSSRSSLEDIVKPEILFKQGRPLWASRMSRKGGGTQFIIDFATTKLLKGHPVTSSEAGLLLQSPFTSLVLLGRRIGVDVCPWSHFAEDLIASHMWVCLHVASSRDYVICTSLPEPVLSEAAAQLLRSDRDLLKRQLRGLDAMLLNGLVSAGERGELVVRFLLIHAMDSLQVSVPCTQPVLLEDFLRASFHGFSGFTGRSQGLKEAKVFFNAFHRIYGQASLQNVRAFLRNGAAMTCTKNQEAYDLYIPYVLPNGSGKYDVEDDTCVGCVGVQVKNRRGFRKGTATMKRMVAYGDSLASISSVEVIPAYFILIYVGVDTAKKPPKCTLPDEILERVFLVRGLERFKVIEGLEEVIEVLLRESPDPVALFRAEKQSAKEERGYEGMATDKAIETENKALIRILKPVLGNTRSERSTEITGPSDRQRKRGRGTRARAEKQSEKEELGYEGMATDEAIARMTNVWGNTHSERSTEITGPSDRQRKRGRGTRARAEKQSEKEELGYEGMATDEAIARKTKALTRILEPVWGNTHSERSTEITGPSDSQRKRGRGTRANQP